MGRAFEFRKARKFKRWGQMAKTFAKIGKDIVEYHPECNLELDDLKRFHSFLESCGGFTVNTNLKNN